ncbi:MAG: 4-hydroxythreonine-4-phosphate dehydrogenase PdxA [Sneathiellaceae bacterium]
MPGSSLRPDRPLCVSMGEPGGIGAEILLQAWLRRREEALPPFFVIDDAERLRAAAAALGWPVPLAVIATPAEAMARFATALPVLPVGHSVPWQPGRTDPHLAAAVIAALDRGVDLTRDGSAAALVTNPIHKKTLYDAGFGFPGHTEYLAARTGAASHAMMLAVPATAEAPGLRAVPATIHVPLRQAVTLLETAHLVSQGRLIHQSLMGDFGIARPRIAVAGLNPHAGEDGALGREDLEIVAPAVAILRAEGIDADGPRPGDTMFHAGARAGYDAALCMYHDQALIPVKTIDFDRGVNVTLGLPIIRTSPDHGTATDIAGQGIARPVSLIAALRLAAEMAACRSRSAVALA